VEEGNGKSHQTVVLISMYNDLVQPRKLWSRGEILSRPTPAPKSSGLYAWYFRNLPGTVPTADCVTCNGLPLLYVGIAPSAPPASGKSGSSRTLYDRLCNHLRSNASGSTLRLTLGCILSEQLNIQLRRVGSGERMTFGSGEKKLSEWMEQNAFVTWMLHPQPWLLEQQIISSLSLPLNLEHNAGHPYYRILSSLRRRAKELARQLPVVSSH
jgi:hypothetical protein